MGKKSGEALLCFSHHLSTLDPFDPDSISSLGLCFLVRCGVHEAVIQSDSRQTVTKGHKFHKIIRVEGPPQRLEFDSSEVKGSGMEARILTNCKLVDIGKVTRCNVLQYLGRLK